MAYYKTMLLIMLFTMQLWSKDISTLKNECEKGNGDSCFLVADAIFGGDYKVDNPDKEAFKYLDKACKNGNADGCGNIAHDFYMEHKLKKAFDYYLQGCKLKDGESCYMSGFMYNRGEYVKLDHDKAKQYFQKGCDLKERKACDSLKELNEYMALQNKLENQCVNNNKKEACYEVGDNYLFTPFFIDMDKAIKYFKKGCDLGDGRSCNKLAFIYMDNEPNLSEKYNIKACEFGQSNNCINLVILNIKRNNYKEVENYYIKACELSDKKACNNLGTLYINGQQGIEIDYKKAIKYYKKGCQSGSLTACRNICNMYKDGLGMKKSNDKAVKCYQNTCKAGDKESCDIMCRVGDKNSCDLLKVLR